MASSSRSMALRSGFCNEYPRPLRMRQIWVWPNLTPYWGSMRSPMRLSVYSSVPQLCSVGLTRSVRPSACNCCSSKRAGHPREGMARSASMPASSSTAFYVYAVCRAVPTVCAACAGILPAKSVRSARKRRRTVSSNRFVTIHRTQYVPRIATTHGGAIGCRALRKEQWSGTLAGPARDVPPACERRCRYLPASERERIGT